MTYDYSNVPSYVAPTEGNMEQTATQIANWIRSKGNGADVRESMAQAVQLFGDVAAQFIKQSEGLKGQFNSAIAGTNTNSEVAAARTSAATGTAFTTLGSRLDAIDTEQAAHDTKLSTGVVDTSSAQDVDGVKNFLQLPIINSGRSLLPSSDSGWLSDGITWLNGSTDHNFYYRVVTIGPMRFVMLFGRINIPASVMQNGFSTSGNILTLPSSAKIGIPSGDDQFAYAVGYSDDCLHQIGLRILEDGVTMQCGSTMYTDTANNSNTHLNAVLFGVDVND